MLRLFPNFFIYFVKTTKWQEMFLIESVFTLPLYLKVCGRTVNQPQILEKLQRRVPIAGVLNSLGSCPVGAGAVVGFLLCH